MAYGLRKQGANEAMGLIYSRLNNPNLEMFEDRVAAWDRTEEGEVIIVITSYSIHYTKLYDSRASSTTRSCCTTC